MEKSTVVQDFVGQNSPRISFSLAALVSVAALLSIAATDPDS